MLIQDAIFPDLDNKEVLKSESLQEECIETEKNTEEAVTETEEVSKPRNRGGRPRKH